MSNSPFIVFLKMFVAVLFLGVIYNIIFYMIDIYYINKDKDEALDFAYNNLLTIWLPASVVAVSTVMTFRAEYNRCCRLHLSFETESLFRYLGGDMPLLYFFSYK